MQNLNLQGCIGLSVGGKKCFVFFQKDFIFPADSVKMAQKNYVFGTLFKYLNIYSPIFGA